MHIYTEFLNQVQLTPTTSAKRWNYLFLDDFKTQVLSNTLLKFPTNKKNSYLYWSTFVSYLVALDIPYKFSHFEHFSFTIRKT